MHLHQGPVLFFTDFGLAGPYVSQMEIAVMRDAPDARVISLISDAPRSDPFHSAYLLKSLVRKLPGGTIVVAVVDPGVGGERRPILISADGVSFVGPDNGLLSQILVGAGAVTVWQIDWRPQELSDSFHGRDLFAPVAARLFGQKTEGLTEIGAESLVGRDWPEELDEIIYIDHFGNAFTGIPADEMSRDAVLELDATRIPYARTFAEVPDGNCFWYRNSSGLVEIAVANGSAAEVLGLVIGRSVKRTH